MVGGHKARPIPWMGPRLRPHPAYDGYPCSPWSTFTTDAAVISRLGASAAFTSPARNGGHGLRAISRSGVRSSRSRAECLPRRPADRPVASDDRRRGPRAAGRTSARTRATRCPGSSTARHIRRSPRSSGQRVRRPRRWTLRPGPARRSALQTDAHHSPLEPQPKASKIDCELRAPTCWVMKTPPGRSTRATSRPTTTSAG